ncbi:MAG: hypothetical protein BGO78_13510 [Chloroflexi bacterium 44-23]|nr:MAG: hypothetical protein BGO78_13510 [Chloroflexi bacterium 44-23]
MTSPQKIAAIILNTNRKIDTLECLTSLEENHYPELEIVVLDNHSRDGSVEAIQSAFPNVHVLAIQENQGYAGNNNVGLNFVKKFDPDWIFVLNEDTIFAPDALRIMMDSVEKNDQVGIIGPLVYHYDEPQVIQSAGGLFDRHWKAYHQAQNENDHAQFTSPFEVDWIHGCAIGIRREALEQAGGLDERFFYYWEETEWCYRVSKMGWSVWMIPRAKIWHKGVQRDYQPGANVTYYATRNRLLFNKIHNAPLRVWFFTWLYFIRILLSWSLRPKWRHKRANRDAMWQGIRDFRLQNWGQRSQTSP